MNRRHYLALVGAGVGSVAGCVGRPPGGGTATGTSTPFESATPTEAGTSTSEGTRVPVGESIEVGGVPMTVSNPRVRKGVLAMGVHDPAVRAAEGQFVVVDVTVEGREPDRLEGGTLRSSVDGDLLPEGDAVSTLTEGVYAVPFSAERHETATVAWQTDYRTVHWTLPEEIRETLPLEPAFHVEGMDIPRRDGQLVLELTVANEGEREGVFLAEVSSRAFSGNDVVSFPVPTGKTRTYTGRAGKMLLYFENNGGGTLTVRYLGDGGVSRIARSREVGETPAGGTAAPTDG
ncbi:MAG: hypothetical protein V5A62_01450 [Haloarculaceae archaeon]